MASHIPLLIDLQNRTVVIFGGGAVAFRKAKLFCQSSNVVVVSLSFSQDLLNLSKNGSLTLVTADLRDGIENHLKGAFLAIPATFDKDLNQQIEDMAKSMGILVNSVDKAGDVVVPSIVRKGSITISISTDVPALTRYLRIMMESVIAVKHVLMARLLSDVRVEIKKSVKSEKCRKKILWSILDDDEIWNLLNEDYEKAYIKAREHIALNE